MAEKEYLKRHIQVGFDGLGETAHDGVPPGAGEEAEYQSELRAAAAKSKAKAAAKKKR